MSESPDISTNNATLGIIPKDAILREASFSANGLAVAFIASIGDKYDTYCPNGSFLTSDVAEHVVLAPDGDIANWKGRRGDLWFIGTNGTMGPLHDWVGDPIQSDDGHRCAYWAMSRGRPSRPDDYRVVLGDWQSDISGAPGGLFFRKDSYTLVFAIQELRSSRVFNGKSLGKSFERIRYLTQCPTANVIWYWGYSAGMWRLMRDDQEVDACTEIDGCSRPVFDAKGVRAAYWKMDKGKWLLVVDGKAIGGYDKPPDYVSSPVFGTGMTIAYVAKRDDRVFVVVDGTAGEPYDAVGPPVLSSAGNVAYMARVNDREFAVVSGRRGPSFDVFWPEEGELTDYLEDQPAFSQDQHYITYRGRNAKRECVFRNDQSYAGVDAISGGPVFVPGTDKVVYVASVDRREVVFADEHIVGTFDKIWSSTSFYGLSMIWRPRFVGRTLVFGARLGHELIWKAIPL